MSVSQTRREIAAQFFKNELEIEKVKEIWKLKEENKSLMGEHPYLRPIRGHLKEKASLVQEEGEEDGDGQFVTIHGKRAHWMQKYFLANVQSPLYTTVQVLFQLCVQFTCYNWKHVRYRITQLQMRGSVPFPRALFNTV